MRVVVKEAWERCTSYGLNPTVLPPQQLDQAKLLVARVAARSLMETAEPFLGTVTQILQNQPHLIALTDTDGLVLRLVGHPTSIEQGRNANLFEGASWHERDCGCNGAGTALAVGHPVVLIGPEHFMANFATWTCVGVPIRGAGGQVVGAVDFSVPNEQINLHTWGWVLSVVQAIESAYRGSAELTASATQQVGRRLQDPLNAFRGILDLLFQQEDPSPRHLGLLTDLVRRLGFTLDDLLTADTAANHGSLQEQSRLDLFLSALDYLTDGFIAIDSDGYVRASNARARDLFEGVALQPGRAVRHLPIPDSLKSALLQAAGQTHFDPAQPATAVVSGGFEAHVVCLLGVGAVAIVHSRADEERFTRLERGLVANVSHELRGPLTTISTLIEAFRDGVIPDQHRSKYLDGISRGLARMGRLVTDAVDLAKIDADRTPPDVEEVDLAILFESLRRHWGSRFAAKQLAYRVATTDLWVLANPDGLATSLERLLDNALRFTPTGGTVRLWSAAEGDRVRISVADTGPGIPPKELPLLSTPFHKVDYARTFGESTGAGLGLTICRRLIERMGGLLEMESAPEKGSTFSIWLKASGRPGSDL